MGAYEDFLQATQAAQPQAQPTLLDQFNASLAAQPDQAKMFANPNINPNNSTEAAMLAGVGRGVGQIGMGAQHWVGRGLQGVGANDLGQQVIDNAAQGNQSMDAELAPYSAAHPVAAGAGRLMGNVAATAPVGSVLGYGVKAAAPYLGAAAPYVEQLAGALSTNGMKVGGAAPTTFGGKALEMGIRSLGSSIDGGISAGLVNPEDWKAGAMIGAAIPPAASGAYALGKGVAQGVKSLVEPLYRGGQEQIVGRTIANAAGSDAIPAAQAMIGASSQVPGVQYTAAESANNPGIAALQRAATASENSSTTGLARRATDNNDALVSALRGMSPDLPQSIADRASAANQLYSAANQKTVQITPEIASLLDTPAGKEAVKIAETLANNNRIGPLFVNAPGTTTPASMNGQAAHYIKMALDDLGNASPVSGVGKAAISGVNSVREKFLQEVESQLPEYALARQTFASMSQPVNKAKAIEDISQRAINFRGNLTPAALNNSLNDGLARRVTGRSSATLSDAFSPNDLQGLNNISGDLLKTDFANTAGRGVGSDTVQKLAYTNLLDRSGVPTWLRNFAPASVIGNLGARIGDAVYKPSNEQIRQLLAQALLSPQQSGNLVMGTMTTPAMQAIGRALQIPTQALYQAAPILGARAMGQ